MGSIKTNIDAANLELLDDFNCEKVRGRFSA